MTLTISALFFCTVLRAQPAPDRDYHSTNSPIFGNFRLTIATTNEVFSKGQPVFLTVSFENISSNSASFSIPFRPFEICVFDSDGKEVPKTEIGKQYLEPTGGGYFGFSIAAGANYAVNTPLTGYFSITNAGDYFVTVQHNQDNAKWSAGPLKIIIAEAKDSK